MAQQRSIAAWLGIALLATTLSLAGCGSKGAAPTAGDEEAATAAPAQFDESAGGIEGQVLDDVGLPVAKALVGIVELGVQTDSDEVGAFSFSNVTPGTYAVGASRIGYSGPARMVEVRAGSVVEVQLILAQVATDQPCSRLYSNSGLYGCGVSWKPAAPAVFNNYTSQSVCALAQGFGDAANAVDQSTLHWESEVPVTLWTALAFEMQWTGSQTLGQGLRVKLEFDDCYNVASTRLGIAAGNSPLMTVADSTRVSQAVESLAEEIEEDDGIGCSHGISGTCDLNATCALESRVESEATFLGEGSVADVGATTLQTFEQWLAIFVRQEVPQGYSALAG